jgi:MinD-like ATPase involved in chromosome partitioning or flagellar assembly
MAYKQMKIAVLNVSGNVGKTAICKNLLKAFRPEAKLISVESFNNSDALDVVGFDTQELNASRFKQIYRELMMNDDVILDVGASNVAQFMEELTKYRASIAELDLVIVPTVPDEKQQKDTYATVGWLHKLGVPADRIRVVFNLYTGDSTVGETYAHVIGYSNDDGKKQATWLPHVIIEKNEIFQIVDTRKTTIRQLAADSSDWKALREAAKAARDMDALESAMDGQMAHDLAVTAGANLEKAYEDLFAPYKSGKK